jgi:hypothetical protein
MGDYEKKVNAATLEQLAGLIKICGFLLQSKVYLFWRRCASIRQYACLSTAKGAKKVPSKNCFERGFDIFRRDFV